MIRHTSWFPMLKYLLISLYHHPLLGNARVHPDLDMLILPNHRLKLLA